MSLAVLGATGSVGASTLDVVARHPDRYRVFALSANGSSEALLKLCKLHKPRYAVLSGVAESRDLRRQFGETELLFGTKALEDVATHPAHQGKGAGSAVVRALVELARQSGCYKVILSCKDENIAFYSKIGFRRHDNGMRIDTVGSKSGAAKT